ncbi:GNAT family N-acetyltransferase [Kitasatospora sp. NPDC057198]|uniref:GNAT family N-acetyltransferase n=1 Tax=Kitasatospora sp. NPDC057198 TaxID=3346046 RepID=UPI0036435C8B
MELLARDVDVPSQALFRDVEPLLRALRPALSGPGFAAFASEAAGQGLVFTAAYDNAPSGKGRCVAVATHRTLATSRGRILFVDDLVTDPALRSGGVGAWLMGELEQRAARSGCVRVELDSGVVNQGAHRFYHARRMSVVAFHFSLDLPGHR